MLACTSNALVRLDDRKSRRPIMEACPTAILLLRTKKSGGGPRESCTHGGGPTIVTDGRNRTPSQAAPVRRPFAATRRGGRRSGGILLFAPRTRTLARQIAGPLCGPRGLTPDHGSGLPRGPPAERRFGRSEFALGKKGKEHPSPSAFICSAPKGIASTT